DGAVRAPCFSLCSVQCVAFSDCAQLRWPQCFGYDARSARNDYGKRTVRRPTARSRWAELLPSGSSGWEEQLHLRKDEGMDPHTKWRDFLKTTSAAGLGFWVAGGVSAQESDSPNEKLNIAIVGA